MKHVLTIFMQIVVLLASCNLADFELVLPEEGIPPLSETAIKSVASPDLRSSYLSGPSGAYPGQAINSNPVMMVGNDGTAVAQSSTGYITVGFYLSTDNQKDENDTLLLHGHGTVSTPLAVFYGESVSIDADIAIPFGTAYGDYYLIGVIDELNNVVESNEVNNTRCTLISICPYKADLFNYSFGAVSSARPGEEIGAGMVLMIINNGFVPAVSLINKFYVGFYLSTDSTYDSSDVLLVGGRECEVTPIAVNEIRDVSIYDGISIPVGITPGNYYLIAVIDEYDTVDEIDEINHFSRSITITN